jgi:hypothetical protein
VSKDPREALAEAIETSQKAIEVGGDSPFADGIMNSHPLRGCRSTDRRPNGPCPIHAIRNGMSILQFSSASVRLHMCPIIQKILVGP